MAPADGASEKDKMLAGELYRAIGPELAADHLRADRLLRAYNATGADEAEQRAAILAELLGAAGEGAEVRPPFHCDYGTNIPRSMPPITRATRLSAAAATSVGCPFASGITCGWAVGPSSYPASVSATTRSSAPASS